MKVFAVIMFTLLATQPATAGFCDMAASGDMAGHAGMQHDMEGDNGGHDCCDPVDGADTGSNISDHCGACAHIAPALPALALAPLSLKPAVLHIRGPDSEPPTRASNLYRPPRPIV